MNSKLSIQKIIRLPIKKSTTTSTPKHVENKAADGWNAMESAKMASEFSKYLGPFRTPAQAYIDSMNFDVEAFVAQPLER